MRKNLPQCSDRTPQESHNIFFLSAHSLVCGGGCSCPRSKCCPELLVAHSSALVVLGQLLFPHWKDSPSTPKHRHQHHRCDQIPCTPQHTLTAGLSLQSSSPTSHRRKYNASTAPPPSPPRVSTPSSHLPTLCHVQHELSPRQICTPPRRPSRGRYIRQRDPRVRTPLSTHAATAWQTFRKTERQPPA